MRARMGDRDELQSGKGDDGNATDGHDVNLHPLHHLARPGQDRVPAA